METEKGEKRKREMGKEGNNRSEKERWKEKGDREKGVKRNIKGNGTSNCVS